MTQVTAAPEMTQRTIELVQPPLRKYKKIAVLGYTSHREQAPYTGPGSEEWGIWGINDLYIDIPEVDNRRVRWFQLHTWMEIQKWCEAADNERPLQLSGGPPHPRDPNHVSWLTMASQNIPVFLKDARDEVPLAYVFPYEAVFQYFAKNLHGYQRNIYFTNSISYMLGLAIMELIDPATGRAYEGAELGCWGVDMMMSGGSGSEYGYQRPSVEWLLGYAMGAGINVHVPGDSDLLKTAFPYGDVVGAAHRARVEAHRRDLARRLNEVANIAGQHQAAQLELQGAISSLDWELRSHMPGDSELSVPVTVIPPRPNGHKLKEDLLARTDRLPGIKPFKAPDATAVASDGNGA